MKLRTFRALQPGDIVKIRTLAEIYATKNTTFVQVDGESWLQVPDAKTRVAQVTPLMFALCGSEQVVLEVHDDFIYFESQLQFAWTRKMLKGDLHHE